MIETSTKYNQYAARIPKGMGLGVVGSLSFDVQGWGVGGAGVGCLPNLDPFGKTEKGEGGLQTLDIFHGCHKVMVPNHDC